MTEVDTPESAVESPSKIVTGRDVVVLGGTLLLWLTMVSWAARSVGVAPLLTPTWDRWDTGQYLSIAKDGYVFERCVGVANRGPEDWCGNSGWFPLYPYMMRVGSWTGLGYDTVGRAIALASMVTAWTALWFGFLRRRPIAAGALGMAIAAAFPSSVYYGAIFPVATMLAAALLALVCVDRRRWLLAGMCAAVAALVYPSGVLVGTLALVPLTAMSLGDVRTRVRAALMVGLPTAIAYVGVMVNFQRAVGAWDAWYKTAASYRLEATFPLVMIYRQVEKMADDAHPGVIGTQTLLVAAMVVAAGWVAVTKRRELSLGERGAAVMCLFLWLMPLALGGDLSLYRAESLLLPIVILLSRLRLPVLAVFAIVCVPVGYKMAQLFFTGVLI